MVKWRCEKGIALLLVIVILFILSYTFIHFVALYETEKNFLTLEKEWNDLNALLLNSANEVVFLLNEDTDIQLRYGTLDFFNGTVHYQITDENAYKKVVLKAKLNNGSERNARFLYDPYTKYVTNWVEGVGVH
ncbi:competence type IV pilus minor pilin ComGG [Evansella cellulosilytica]|uniref:Uncharacterized protein n=1 Tax=Evansella cellulosilytica (strain ATCC 21833 / DSM 2522 / FERM P-1141 / JCM 9156 / N-4) TaxID=649639 RepID=E6TWZ4_EVAC2|nr:competence type IV pilus minor pilin ComGG [Evansella cellulosilytica]ADU29944.1 hypothetical protein Bcell_1681 [Evansella cellulosilytica DSM 2522]